MALIENVPADKTDIVVVDVEIYRTAFYDGNQQNDTDIPKTFSVRLSKGQTKTEYFTTAVSMIS